MSNPNTHCPGCGVHRDAIVGDVIVADDGNWKCVRCVSREAVIAQPSEPMVAVRCPACRGDNTQSHCGTCGGLGQVRVALSSLNAYAPQAGTPQLLTEG